MTNLTSANTGAWGEFLGIFKTLIDSNPPPESIRTELEALIVAAGHSSELTYRQKDAIQARCENYLKGDYGNTKTQANLDYGKTPTPPQK